MARLDPTPLAVARRAAELLAVLTPAGTSPTVGSVVDVLRRHGEPEPIELDLADVTALRAAARELLDVFGSGELPATVDRLNELLARYAGPPRLTAHLDTPWHLHVDADDDGPWDEWFVASSALGIATLIAERQVDPTGLCASTRCRRPFVDTGRGGPRRYCSPRCATRERVAAHRAAG